jgi:hypothetical protein
MNTQPRSSCRPGTTGIPTYCFAAGFYLDGQFVIESKDDAGRYRRYCFANHNRPIPELFKQMMKAK